MFPLSCLQIILICKPLEILLLSRLTFALINCHDLALLSLTVDYEEIFKQDKYFIMDYSFYIAVLENEKYVPKSKCVSFYFLLGVNPSVTLRWRNPCIRHRVCKQIQNFKCSELLLKTKFYHPRPETRGRAVNVRLPLALRGVNLAAWLTLEELPCMKTAAEQR